MISVDGNSGGVLLVGVVMLLLGTLMAHGWGSKATSRGRFGRSESRYIQGYGLAEAGRDR